MARFDRINNEAPAQVQLQKDTSPVGRSAHDFSYIHSGNALFGAVIPVDCFDVVPNEDLQISLAALLEFRNPTTRQLLNSCRVYFHAYYNRLTDLWEGARNWIDKGRSGKIDLSRPNLLYHRGFVTHTTNDVYCNANTPLSLLNFLGLAAEVIHKDSTIVPLRSFQAAGQYYDLSSSDSFTEYEKISDSVDFFPADCCMAYQRNWRDFYSNKNLLQTNKYWFPDNEDHFILSYSCENAVCVKYEDEDFSSESEAVQNESIFVNITGSSSDISSSSLFIESSNSLTPEPSNPITSSDSISGPKYYPNLSGLKFRQFRGDRFTTALPFPDLIRGDIPILQITSDSISKVQLYDIATGKIVSDNSVNLNGEDVAEADSFGNLNFYEGSSPTIDARVKYSGSSITMSDIYTLETLTAFKRRMAMTNGDYNEMIQAQFGVNPNVHDRHAIYLGGYYQDFAFNSVTQTSESSGTPLGTKAGQGVSNGSGSIGSFHVPDYGWIQIYMSIVPDVMYTQGKPRMFSKKSNLEMYFPIFNNLPAQAIRKDELYVTAVDPSSPFAYEDRYAEYKSRTNRVSGFMGLSHSQAAFDSARIMARRFSSSPALNSLFVTMVPENIDMEVFTVVDEPPIDFSVGVSVRRVFPGPYTAIEGSLSSPALMR